MVAVTDVLEEHAELVANQPRDRVAGPDGRGETGCDLLEKDVADGVPEAVPDVGKALDAADQHGDGAVVPPQPDEGVGDPFQEECPIRTTGDRVTKASVAQLALQPVPFGDVLDDGEDFPSSEEVQRAGADLDVDQPSVLAAVAGREPRSLYPGEGELRGGEPGVVPQRCEDESANSSAV